MVQCTILQQNGKYDNIPALLLGALLYPNNNNNRWRLDRSILYIRENVYIIHYIVHFTVINLLAIL